MWFKRASVRYEETPVAVTPYQAAQQLWDERIGSARVQAKNWRVMAFACMGLCVAVVGGLIWQAGRSTITPYVVEVDTQGGVRAVGAAAEKYRPSDAQILFQLEQFVRKVRALSIDPVVVRENWLEAYDYVTPRGAGLLNEYARTKDPFARVGRESVAIEVSSRVRVSESSFQLRWVERAYLNGTLTSTQRWTAILSIVLRAPSDEVTIRKNPLGIYVDGLDWSRELGAGAQGDMP